LLDAGRVADALTSAEQALSMEGTNPVALRTRMFARSITSGRLDQAGYVQIVELQGESLSGPERWDVLVAAYPKSALPLMGRASAGAGEDIAVALADLSAAVALEPDNEEALAAYGLLLLEAKRPAEALAALTPAVAARPRDASLAEAMARAAAGVGDLGMARSKLEEVIAERPDRVNAVVLLAGIMSEGGDAEGAYRMLRAAVERNRDATLALALAGAARDTGRVLEAAGILEALGSQLGSEQMIESAKSLREHHATADEGR